MTSWSSALCSVWTAKKDRLGTSLIRQLRPLFLCSTSYSRKRGKYLYSLLEKSQISLSFGGKWEYLGKLTITKTSWCRIMISFVDISSSLQALFSERSVLFPSLKGFACERNFLCLGIESPCESGCRKTWSSLSIWMQFARSCVCREFKENTLIFIYATGFRSWCNSKYWYRVIVRAILWQ